MAQLAAAPEPERGLVPPQNLEAEESILGAVMLSPGAISVCRDILTDGREFYRESHTRIWRAALRLADRGEPVDAITLCDELDQAGHLDDVGGRVRIHELAGLVPASANAGHYARIVVEQSQLRELIRVGAMIQRLGWEGSGGDAAALLEQARTLTAELDSAAGGGLMESETWAQFERSATETIPMLVDGLWPEAGLGFIAAPPKKGKTWVALDLAISVASGTRFLASFDVAKPEPVVYLALEGHRAAIRGRIGALAHGHGLQPQGGHDLDNLHIAYKPAGLNLADPAWIRNVRDLIERVGAKLVIVDVLRAAAVMKENSNDEFSALIRALQPIQTAGCAIAILHHFGKLTEVSKERTPGERMAGAGAMYGAFDVGVFITKSDEGARELRIEFETRDVVAPDPLAVHLDGDTTGQLGGFVFSDSASWTVVEDDPIDDDTAVFITWLEAQRGMAATTSEICHAFDMHTRTIARRRPAWEANGVLYDPAKGKKPARYHLPVSWTNALGGHVTPSEGVHLKTPDLQGNLADLDMTGHGWTNASVHQAEMPDLQALSLVDRVDSPTESSPPVADAAATAPKTESDDEIDWTA